jgi:hypothetical protein
MFAQQLMPVYLGADAIAWLTSQPSHLFCSSVNHGLIVSFFGYCWTV